MTVRMNLKVKYEVSKTLTTKETELTRKSLMDIMNNEVDEV